jgi:hypothetical protein
MKKSLFVAAAAIAFCAAGFVGDVDAAKRFSGNVSTNVAVRAFVKAIVSVLLNGEHKNVELFDEYGTVSAETARTIYGDVQGASSFNIRFNGTYSAKEETNPNKEVPFEIWVFPDASNIDARFVVDNNQDISAGDGPFRAIAGQRIKFLFALKHPHENYDVGTYKAAVAIEIVPAE